MRLKTLTLINFPADRIDLICYAITRVNFGEGVIDGRDLFILKINGSIAVNLK